MVNRLPGFSFDSGDNVRGSAGAACNVLIDGARPTSKADGLGDTLARIPVDQVQRIDIMRGGASGVDMQGQTVVANVIRKKVDTFQQVFSVRSFLFFETGKTIPGWNYQATRRRRGRRPFHSRQLQGPAVRRHAQPQRPPQHRRVQA